KIDARDEPSRVERLEARARERSVPFFRVSGVTGAGVDALLGAVWHELAAERERERHELEVRDLDASLFDSHE
ncbi:MAG TPA: hypothetical protein VND92_06440, partial [Vicinamibacterales bacterium]|nr:hypothetical protein [Vicinamibacterales bacterium]